jgi:hypothetical protein
MDSMPQEGLTHDEVSQLGGSEFGRRTRLLTKVFTNRIESHRHVDDEGSDVRLGRMGKGHYGHFEILRAAVINKYGMSRMNDTLRVINSIVPLQTIRTTINQA